MNINDFKYTCCHLYVIFEIVYVLHDVTQYFFAYRVFLSMMLTHVILGFWWKAHPLGLSIVQVVEFLRDQWRGLIYMCKHHMRNRSNMKNISKSNDLNFRYESQNINSLQAYVIDFCRFYLIGPSYKRFTCWQVTLWNKEWHG